MKKVVSILLVAAILCCALAGCKKNVTADSSSADPASQNPTTSQGESALQMLPEDFDLSDEAMEAAVSAYVEQLSELCRTQTAEATDTKQITGVVLNVLEDGTVNFDATAVDEDGVETTVMAYSFNSMKEAYAYLYVAGCVDANGNLLTSGEVVMEQEDVDTEADAESETEIEADAETEDGTEEAANSEAEIEAEADSEVEVNSEAEADNEGDTTEASEN